MPYISGNTFQAHPQSVRKIAKTVLHFITTPISLKLQAGYNSSF